MSLSIRSVYAFFLTVFLAAPDRLAATHTGQDPVRAWNERALHTVRTLRLSDAQAARLYAMVNVAMYDAVNGIMSRRGWGERAHALVRGGAAPPLGDPRGRGGGRGTCGRCPL